MVDAADMKHWRDAGHVVDAHLKRRMKSRLEPNGMMSLRQQKVHHSGGNPHFHVQSR